MTRKVLREAGLAPWILIVASACTFTSTIIGSSTLRTVGAVLLLVGVVASYFNIRRLRRRFGDNKARRGEWT